MEERRFQVFISSTFEDLREERQAAVETVLKAGHIPAGMELFTAGNQSQMEVIRQWIRDCDLFVLILGGRYGSIEPTSGLSYTELEYRYAIELDKPFFAIVIRESAIELKVKDKGLKAVERANVSLYEAFRKDVCSKHSAFFETAQEVKLAIYESLPQLVKTPGLAGWVSGRDADLKNAAALDVIRLTQANRELQAEINKLKKSVAKGAANLVDYQATSTLLKGKRVDIPGSIIDTGKAITLTLQECLLTFESSLVRGVRNQSGVHEAESFVFHEVASPLLVYGLVEADKVPTSVHWRRFRLSKAGAAYIREYRLQSAQAGAVKTAAKKK